LIYNVLKEEIKQKEVTSYHLVITLCFSCNFALFSVVENGADSLRKGNVCIQPPKTFKIMCIVEKRHPSGCATNVRSGKVESISEVMLQSCASGEGVGQLLRQTEFMKSKIHAHCLDGGETRVRKREKGGEFYG
jgi:hypothetical protein